MWKNQADKLARICPQIRIKSALRFKYTDRVWIKSGSGPEKTSGLSAQVKRGTPVMSKLEFQKKMEACLTELKQGPLVPPERPIGDLVEDETLRSHPIVKAMESTGNTPWPGKLLDEKSSGVLASDELKREFVKQTAMAHEFTHKFNVPSCGFQNFSMEEIDKCLRYKYQMTFILRKAAMKYRDAINKSKKQAQMEKSEPDKLERNDPIPTYRLKRRQHGLTEYRIQNTLNDLRPLIFDMSFETLMNDKGKKSLCSQLVAVMNHNVANTTPFNVVLCNLNESSQVYQTLMKTQPFNFPNGLWTVTENSLLDVEGVNLENLIYLTPDANGDMGTFDDTKSYVIGGLVDIGANSSVKATYNYANMIGVEKVKFPLHKYLVWGNRSGRDELTLDVAYKILHTYRDTGSWVKALVHTPKRFHRGLTEFGLSKCTGEDDVMKWYSRVFDQRSMPKYPNRPRLNKASPFKLGWR